MKQLAEISVAIAAATLGVGAFAQGAPATSACVSINDEAQRLACYDATHRRDAAIPMPTEPPPALAAPPAALATPAADVGLSPGGGAGPWLSKLWDLRPEDKQGTLQLRPHRANYMLPARYTNRPNRTPSSPGAGNANNTELPADATEAKFQLSFKVKAIENVFGDNGDLWLAYTQQANWQIYNGGFSSPFRNIDHEPEAILSLRTGGQLLGWNWDLLNLGKVRITLAEL